MFMTKIFFFLILFSSSLFAQEVVDNFEDEPSAPTINEELRKLRKRVLVVTGADQPTRDGYFIFMPSGMFQNSSKPDRTSDNEYMQFDPTDVETANIPAIILPGNFDASLPVIYQVAWQNGDSGIDGIVWRLKSAVSTLGGAYSSYSSGDLVADTSGGANMQNLTDETSVTESWAANDVVKFQIARVPTDAGDTGDTDAFLRSVIIKYKKTL